MCSTSSLFGSLSATQHSALEHSRVSRGVVCDDKLGSTLLIGPYPRQSSVEASSLWRHRPVLLLVLRRLGCPLVRDHAAEVAKLANAWRFQGFDMAVIAGDVSAADGFVQAWASTDGTPLPLYLDSSLEFCKALGGREAQLWRVLAPSVLKHISSCSQDPDFSDVNSATQYLGGEMVLDSTINRRTGAEQPLAVLHTALETEYFEMASPGDTLARAISGKSEADELGLKALAAPTPLNSDGYSAVPAAGVFACAINAERCPWGRGGCVACADNGNPDGTSQPVSVRRRQKSFLTDPQY